MVIAPVAKHKVLRPGGRVVLPIPRLHELVNLLVLELLVSQLGVSPEDIEGGSGLGRLGGLSGGVQLDRTSGDGVVVGLMRLCGRDGDSQNAGAVALPDGLRALRILPAVLSDGDEGELDLLVQRDGRHDVGEGGLDAVLLLLLVKLCHLLDDGDHAVAGPLRPDQQHSAPPVQVAHDLLQDLALHVADCQDPSEVGHRLPAHREVQVLVLVDEANTVETIPRQRRPLVQSLDEFCLCCLYLWLLVAHSSLVVQILEDSNASLEVVYTEVLVNGDDCWRCLLVLVELHQHHPPLPFRLALGLLELRYIIPEPRISLVGLDLRLLQQLHPPIRRPLVLFLQTVELHPQVIYFIVHNLGIKGVHQQGDIAADPPIVLVPHKEGRRKVLLCGGDEELDVGNVSLPREIEELSATILIDRLPNDCIHFLQNQVFSRTSNCFSRHNSPKIVQKQLSPHRQMSPIPAQYIMLQSVFSHHNLMPHGNGAMGAMEQWGQWGNGGDDAVRCSGRARHGV